MTLLASERSLLIRNKFRSVLQLRIQNRRQQNELNAESGTKASIPDKVGEKEASRVSLRQTEDGATQKSPPSGLTAQTAPDRSYSGAHRQKKARLAEDLSKKIQSQPGPLELLHRHILPLENTASLPSDVFEDDNSSSASASPEQLGMHQSPGLSSPGQGGDQSLSDASSVATPISPHSVQQCKLALLPATEGISQPMTMTVMGSNSISTTGRSKGMYMPSQTPPLLPKVSVLRQQLRKRGLPVSGTKPALLERLRPFQMPRPPLTPAPLCQQGATLESTHPASLKQLPTSLDPSANPAPMYINPSGLAEQSLGSDSYLTSPSSAGSSPTLHRSSTSTPSGTTWRPGQAIDELSVELEMRERMRSRPREGAKDTQLCENSLHPFLQQETGCTRGKPDTGGQELLFTYCAGDGKVNCCQLCDVIGQDFDLPMQITASPAQVSPSVRSLEEELQEAIQRVQMDPSQSIDDILDETISCSDNSSLITDVQSATTILSGSSPAPQPDQSQSTKRQKDDNFLSSPLCSSLLLELPPSPNNAPPLSSTPAPLLPPPICTTPPSRSLSRKRRSEVPDFDPADWLESLTSSLQPLMPPAAPFLESDFGLDSDLNVNRVLDLMVEQW
ncbi:hypothetical protein cypCar_00010455 [Cyprinus carpio]|nr:hypothetical protein cypCar_00010455 [Cyprinus carpio]